MSENARISVLEAMVPVIIDAQKEHQRRDDETFERVFKQMAFNHQAVMRRLDVSDKRTQDLLDERNRQIGALKFSKFVGNAVSGLISSVFTLAGAWIAFKK